MFLIGNFRNFLNLKFEEFPILENQKISRVLELEITTKNINIKRSLNRLKKTGAPRDVP